MYRSILVPTDGSNLSARAVTQAIAFARATGARLTTLCVMPEFLVRPTAGFTLPESMLEPVRKQLEAEKRAKCQAIVDRVCTDAAAADVACGGVLAISDAPYEAIIKQATKSKCDLIIMASHGRRGLQGILLGSETQKVLTHSKIPVLVVR
jgi:nucleotide-binding universal stress UspA family protein